MNKTVVLAMLIVMSIIGVSLVSTIQLKFPDKDNTQLIVIILGFMTTTSTAVIGLISSLDNRAKIQDVSDKMEHQHQALRDNTDLTAKAVDMLSQVANNQTPALTVNVVSDGKEDNDGE